MTDARRINRDLISDLPWADEFLGEMDLVIAVNTIEALNSHRTLYNDMLEKRVAECVHLVDGGLDFKKLDLVRIPPNDEAPYRRADDAVAFLKKLPRGHWAVFEKDGAYDAFMSDGYGGVASGNGLGFSKNSGSAPAFNEMELYSRVLGYMVYIRRNEIEKEIMTLAFEKAGIKPGQTYQGFRIDGKEYGKVEVVEIKRGYYSGHGDAVEVKATRRGVKPIIAIVPDTSFAARIGAEITMPPEYENIDNHARLVVEFLTPARSSAGIRIGFN